MFLIQTDSNLEPGGYLELQDFNWPYESDDGTLLESHALQRWCRLLQEAAEKLGRPLIDPSKYAGKLMQLGFEDVHQRIDKWPVNPWPKDRRHKELGLWTHENILRGIEAFSLALLTRGLGWSRAEVDILLVDLRKCLKDRSIHAYVSM